MNFKDNGEKKNIIMNLEKVGKIVVEACLKQKNPYFVFPSWKLHKSKILIYISMLYSEPYLLGELRDNAASFG